MSPEQPVIPFSDQIERWSRSRKPKTLETLIEVSEDKSFAVVILLLLLPSALPIPTAGITHLFEIAAMLLALEMVVGLKNIWLPDRLKRISVAKMVKGKGLTIMLKRVRWLERHSTPRGRYIFAIPLVDRITAILLFCFTLAAFISPPFSGLDTLPSAGVVIICLAIILDDAVLLFLGAIAGFIGVSLLATLGTAVFEGVQRIL